MLFSPFPTRGTRLRDFRAPRKASQAPLGIRSFIAGQLRLRPSAGQEITFINKNYGLYTGSPNICQWIFFNIHFDIPIFRCFDISLLSILDTSALVFPIFFETLFLFIRLAIAVKQYRTRSLDGTRYIQIYAEEDIPFDKERYFNTLRKLLGRAVGILCRSQLIYIHINL
jgi:hypothetical protein